MRSARPRAPDWTWRSCTRDNGTLQVEQLYHYIRVPEVSVRWPSSFRRLQARDSSGSPAPRRLPVSAGCSQPRCAYIDSLRAEYPRLPIAIVTQDQAGSAGSGKAIRAAAAERWNVPTSGPPDTSAAQQRLKGMQEEDRRGEDRGHHARRVDRGKRREDILSGCASPSSQETPIDLMPPRMTPWPSGEEGRCRAASDLARVPFTVATVSSTAVGGW